MLVLLMKVDQSIKMTDFIRTENTDKGTSGGFLVSPTTIYGETQCSNTPFPMVGTVVPTTGGIPSSQSSEILCFWSIFHTTFLKNRHPPLTIFENFGF